MFIGRKQEIELLEQLYNSSKFEFAVVYGRRRVGKTSLLKKFAEDKNVIFFSAQEKNDALNLADFSSLLQKYFEKFEFGVFENWQKAFQYFGEHSRGHRLVLIIDEFPFLAQENPSVKSILQHIIDHKWLQEQIMLVLCGSSVSFMEEDVLGYSSPLYGRITAQLEIKPFDYWESSLFFPKYSNEEKALAYGILGGVPCYLETFTDGCSIQKNISNCILGMGSFMREEPQILLKMELRQPSVYNSIMEAVAGGATRLNEIAAKIHEDSQKCFKYISVLRNLRLLDKIIPVGEDATSRRGIYAITDNYFCFWYHFLFTRQSYLELLGPEDGTREIMQPDNINDYMGKMFEKICLEFMWRQAKAKKLPFIPFVMGKWWGSNPHTHQQQDVDILAIDKNGSQGIFCECKYRNEAFDLKKFERFVKRRELFPNLQRCYFFVFSKGGFTKDVKNLATSERNICLLTIDDLFNLVD